MKRPAFQFYPADWRKDVELRSCSVAARGLWIDLLCIAHECEPYGHLTVNGKAMNAAQIAGQVGLTRAQCSALLQELIDNGVARRADDGAIYSKRMVDDEDLRNRRAAGGDAGASHGQKGREHGAKGGRPRHTTGDKKPPSVETKQPPLEPPPSSSSSSSTSITPKPAAAPPGVSDEVWAEWRKKRGKSLTSYAVNLQAKFLAEQGGDPNEIINQSIRNNWDGLFPLKRDGPAGSTSKRDAVMAEIFKGPTNDRPDERTIDGETQRLA